MDGSEGHDLQDQHVQRAFENFRFFLFHRIPRCSMLIPIGPLRVKWKYFAMQRSRSGKLLRLSNVFPWKSKSATKEKRKKSGNKRSRRTKWGRDAFQICRRWNREGLNGSHR